MASAIDQHILFFIFLTDLGQLGIIGKYERGENLPSIEMTLKMSKAFNVTIDFLIGDGEFASFDKDTVDRITSIQQLDQKTKSILFNLIDTYIQNFKTKQAFAK